MIPNDPTKSILLVAFGTSGSRGRKAYDLIERMVKEAFPNVDVRWAFTSGTIRKKLRKEGRAVDSPETALARMMDEGIREVALLPLHVIPGEEFHNLSRNARLYAQMNGGFRRVCVARPLLSSHGDMVRVVRGLLNIIPEDRKPGDAVIFMGHGSKRHPSDTAYAAMNYLLQDMAPCVYVATLEGIPSIRDILGKLCTSDSRKVYLVPFMVAAGMHAVRDMAGDHPESWKSILEKAGFTCEILLSGTAEFPEIVEVWLDHLREAFGTCEQ